MAETETIFSQIIKGQIPCHKIYEDQYTLAFLDIYPVQEGMTLVVSKRSVETFYDLPKVEYQAFFETVKKVALRLKEVYPQKRRIGLQLEGLDVPHVHAKLFPIDSGQEFRAAPDMSKEPDHQALEATAAKIAF